MKLNIENAMRTPSENAFLKASEDTMLKTPVQNRTPHLDFKEGDIVQVMKGCDHAGKVGRIIGVQYSTQKKRMYYTVQFSDKTSAKMRSKYIRFVNRENEAKYEAFLNEHPDCELNGDE